MRNLRFVIAGNFKEYRDYLREQNLTSMEAVWIDSFAKIRGIVFDGEELIYLPSAQKIPDIARINEYIILKNTKRKAVSPKSEMEPKSDMEDGL